MSRGPKLEQIENHDYPTMRIEIEKTNGERVIVDGCELLESHEAIEKARRIWGVMKHAKTTEAVCVVNERTGFTRDRISRG